MVYFSIMATNSSTTTGPSLRSEDILLIETLAANAWPPEQSIMLDGWRLRSAGGITRRANSVWPNVDSGAASLEDKLAAAERHYAALGQPSIFQICDAARPTGLDAALAGRGYSANSHTFVQTASIRDLLQNLPPLRLYPHFEIEVSEEFYEEWFALYCLSEEVSGHAADMRCSILQRIEPTHGFALLRIGGKPAAAGLGVAEAGWLGVFCMATLPEYRRQRAASALLRTLAIWGQLYDAQHVYLQVMQSNTAAQKLYAQAGFATAYHYHYREKRLK
jgi:ribosomal protein S18 acetylase RimI-like enzyme